MEVLTSYCEIASLGLVLLSGRFEVQVCVTGRSETASDAQTHGLRLAPATPWYLCRCSGPEIRLSTDEGH